MLDSLLKKRNRMPGWIGTLAILLFLPKPLPAAEYHLCLELTDTYYNQSHYLDRYTGHYDRDRSYNFLTAAPSLTLSLEKNALIYLRGDLQWIYEPDVDPQREDDDGEQWDTFMTSAYLSVGDKPFQLVAGLQPVEFGSSLIAADDAPGLTLTLTRHRWSLTGQAAEVMESSPMAGLTLGYTPGLFEHVSLFGVWFRDGEDAFARTLPDLYQLLEPTSHGELWWLGGSAELFVGRARLALTAALEYGDITFEHRFEQVRWDVQAYIGDMALSVNLNARSSCELFFFIASGDDDARDGTLHAFLSPTPYNPRALIFFDPEWLDRNTTSVMTYGGSTVHGAVAPGIRFSFEPVEKMLLQAAWTVFYPQQAPADDRDQYGWEFDAQASFSIRHNIEIYLDAARFEYGSYFKDGSGQVPEAAMLFALGCRVPF